MTLRTRNHRRGRPSWPVLSLMLILATVLAGCATGVGTPTQRYLLEAGGDGAPPEVSGSRTLVVESPRLAAYLDSDGIVMQTGPVSIHQASNHLWAEDLAGQLGRMLRHGLARRVTGLRVVGPGEAPPDRNALRLRMDVESFQGRYDGYAVVAGEWRLLAADGTPREARRFRIERALSADGYAALVNTLAAAWRVVVAGVAEALATDPSPDQAAARSQRKTRSGGTLNSSLSR